MASIRSLVILTCHLFLVLQTAAKNVSRSSRIPKGSGKKKDRFEIQPLPYPKDSLEPYISQQTVEIIHGAVQAQHIQSINHLTKGNPDFDSDAKLVDVIRASRDSEPLIFQHAAQCWNLAFWFDCMTENYEDPPENLEQALEQDFGSFEMFKKMFTDSGKAVFGSGFTWLVYDTIAQKLLIMNSLGADNPFAISPTWIPILGMNVWEHAYYLDYQDRRSVYIKRFLERLVDWDQVDDNLIYARWGRLNNFDDDGDPEDETHSADEDEESGDEVENDEDESDDEAATDL